MYLVQYTMSRSNLGRKRFITDIIVYNPAEGKSGQKPTQEPGGRN